VLATVRERRSPPGLIFKKALSRNREGLFYFPARLS
jgi:hypothetical protein